MLSLKRYPHMNRAQRRDPGKHERALWPIQPLELSPLAWCLMTHAGILKPEFPAPASKAPLAAYAPPVRAAGKSILAKFKGWLGKLLK